MSYHKLMMENHTLFSKMVFERLSGQELSAGQPKVLEYLIEHDGVAQKDIAEACIIEPATATSLLARMEKTGLIDRRSREDDKRYILVYLTEKGRARAEASVNVLSDVEEHVFEGFSDAEREAFISYLERVNGNLRKSRAVRRPEKQEMKRSVMAAKIMKNSKKPFIM